MGEGVENHLVDGALGEVADLTLLAGGQLDPFQLGVGVGADALDRLGDRQNERVVQVVALGLGARGRAPQVLGARLGPQRVAEEDDRGAQEPAAVVAQPQSPQELVGGDDDVVGMPGVESADPLRQGDAVEVAGAQRRRGRRAVRVGAGEPDLLAVPVAQGDAAGVK